MFTDADATKSTNFTSNQFQNAMEKLGSYKTKKSTL